MTPSLFDQPQVTYQPQRGDENRAIYNENYTKLKGQCLTAYKAMMRGERLTQRTAMDKYSIGDLRPRIASLIKAGIPIQKNTLPGGFKEFFI